MMMMMIIIIIIIITITVKCLENLAEFRHLRGTLTNKYCCATAV